MAKRRQKYSKQFQNPIIRIEDIPMLRQRLEYFEGVFRSRRMAPSEIAELNRLRELKRRGHL